MDANRDHSWDEVCRAVVPMTRPDNRTNIFYLLREYTLIACVLLVGSTTYNAWRAERLSAAEFVPLAVAIAGLAAIGQHRLSGLAHDASHHVLFRNRVANELVSDLLILFPLVAITQQYRSAHAGHHRYVNDPERDPDMLRLNHPHPHIFPVAKREFWTRYVFKALWPPSILSYLIGRAKAANLGTRDGVEAASVYRLKVARTMRGAYWLSLFTIVHALGAWPVFFLFWIAPLLTIYPMIMQLREIAHHSNAPDAGDLTNSRVFKIHPILGAIVFPYGQAFHLTHHLFATVPHHRMTLLHELLLRNARYRETVVVCHGYFFRTPGTGGPSVLDVLSPGRQSGLFRGPSQRRGERARTRNLR